MEYTVLARRFRPQVFGDVVGQEAIAQALQNAIAAGRVAHAYLFTGARGVGKTSTARILAKTLNCPSAKDGNPCNQCEVCQGVSEGGDVDVIEIDGASNRGIDEIRTLRANVNVRPMRCRYKIYIIDEVHMLTKEAFNALLKTLEEPPPNVKFIFCTTDPQKLPETILSRCQRFDFGTIETHRIRQRLLEIARAEGVEVEPAAIDLVARRANGSMRDSQSLFDQLLAFGGPRVGQADVHRLLGTAPDSRLVEMVRALATRERAQVLTQFDQTLTQGVQLAEFTDQLIACCRDVMVLAAGAGGAPLLGVGEDCRGELDAIGKQWGLQSILAALQILADTRQRMKWVNYGRILMELALVRIATLADLELLAETIALLKSGKVPAGPVVIGGGATAVAVSGQQAPGAGIGAALRPAAAPAAANPAAKGEQQPGLSTGEVLPRTSPPLSDPGVTGSQAGPTGGAPGGAIDSLPAAHATPAERGVHPPDLQLQAGDLEQKANASPIGPDTQVAVASDPHLESQVELGIVFEAGREREIWDRVMSRLPESANKKWWIAGRPAISGPNCLALHLPASYSTFKQRIDRSPEPLRELEAVLEQVVGRPIRLQVELMAPPVPLEGATPREPDRRTPPTELDPYIQKALAAFGATVVRVDRLEQSAQPREDRAES